MQMHVSYALAAVLPRVHYHAISALGHVLRLGNAARCDEQFTHDFRIRVRQFRDGCNVSPGNDEHMNRGAGIEIPERHHLFRFVHDIRLDRAAGDATEYAIGFAQPSSSMRDPDSYGNAQPGTRYCSTTIQRRHPLNIELIEHASRVLERTTGRTLAADALYERVSREAGLNVGLACLLTCVRGAADRFIILPAAAPLDDDSGWIANERSLYATAMAEAGLSSAPTIMLAERPIDHSLAEQRRPTVQPAGWDDGATIDTTHAGLLSDLHGALSDLLRSADEDQELQRMVSSSLASLEAYRQMDAGS
jgi:hypothetical protein